MEWNKLKDHAGHDNNVQNRYCYRGGAIMQVRNNRIPLFVIATLLFGLKTYLVYRFFFDLSIENPMQEFILFFNPIASAYLVFAVSVWFKPNSQRKYLRWTTLLGTLVLFFNLIFYRNFTDFITLRYYSKEITQPICQEAS